MFFFAFMPFFLLAALFYITSTGKILFLQNKIRNTMNVRIGDIVRFISEKLEGKVTGIIDANSVNVYCDE